MPESIIQRSFAAGELAPSLHARADLAKYTIGAKTVKNFIVRKEGGVANRAGTRFVEACKDNDAGKRLMRYVSRFEGFSVLIEIGQGYFRFYLNGEAILVSGVPPYNGGTTYVPGDLVASGGVNYYCHTETTGNAPPNASFWYPLTSNILEIPTPYNADDLFEWNQSANVITLTHHDHPPRELIFASLTRWVLNLVTTTPSVSPPGGVSGTAGAAGARTYAYVVTSAFRDTYEESNQSAVATIAGCAEPTKDAPNVITWTPVPNTAEYYVYADPYENGVFGFVGTATTASFRDAGFIPDFAVTPPVSRNLFSSPDEHPQVSAMFQQRRWFANLDDAADALYGSRTGFYYNFGISSPLQDDDSITFRIAGNNHHAIQHMIALKTGLVLMTDGGEWTVTGGGGPGTPITPSSINAEQETYVGIKESVRPVVIGNTILYVQARGTVMRELRFDQQVEGLGGKDLSIYSQHLTGRDKQIVAMDYQQVPDSVVWAVRADGRLLGLTYIPEQDIWGWHRHESLSNLPGADAVVTLGVFEDVCVVPEQDEDVAYFIVKRTIGGTERRYIERLESRTIRDGFFASDSFFVDCGLTYQGSPANNFSNLDHLEGQVVAVLGDGVPIFDGDPSSASAAAFTVTGGEITLTTDVSVAHIGLPIRYADLELLDLDTQGSSIRDKRKRVAGVTLLVENSGRTFWIGPSASDLRQYDRQVWEPNTFGVTQALELSPISQFSDTGRVFIRQKDPLPLTVLGVIPNVELGG